MKILLITHLHDTPDVQEVATLEELLQLITEQNIELDLYGDCWTAAIELEMQPVFTIPADLPAGIKPKERYDPGTQPTGKRTGK